MKHWHFISVLGAMAFVAVLLGDGILSDMQPRDPGRYIQPDKPAEADLYYYGQRLYPDWEAPGGWREESRQHIRAIEVSQRLAKSGAEWKWINLGPRNVAGRIRSMAIDPENPAVLYAGSAGGGVWKTTDAGLTWRPLDDLLQNLRIGSIAVNPHNPDLILAGNGEGFVFWQGGLAYGRGIYRSLDAGNSWSLIPDTDNSQFEFVFDVAFDPYESGTVLASTRTGVYRSTNNGTSWERVLTASREPRGMMAVFSQTEEGIVYGALEGFGLFKSTDHGQNWAFLNVPSINALNFTRVYLAAAPSNGRVVYAAFTDRDETCAGIFQTTDGGASFEELAIPINDFSGLSHMGMQGRFNSVLAVHPTNPNIVFAGGIDLYKSVNGGRSWEQISNWFKHVAYPLVHADHHAIVVNPNNHQEWFFASDGGVYRSPDEGKTFEERSEGLVTAQFHSATPHPYADYVIGGTIDNGNLRVTESGEWEDVTGGDGGYTEIDWENTSIVYAELYYLHFMKSTEGGKPFTFKVKMNGIPRQSGFGTSENVNFIAPFVMDWNDPKTLYAGTYRVYKTTNGAELWEPISDDLTNNTALSTIAVSPSHPDVLYTGSVNGLVYRTTNGGAQWRLSRTGLPNRYITDIAIDQGNPDIAYVTVSGFGSGHLYLTTDGGALWTNVSGTASSRLPNVPANTVLLHPHNSDYILVGTDVGLFFTEDRGTTWKVNNDGIGNVSIADLRYRRDGTVFAGTHGRGAYRTNVPIFESSSVQIPERVELLQNFPNPVGGTTETTVVPYTLPSAGRVNLELYEASGRKVLTIDEGVQAEGKYSILIDAGRVGPGVYFYRLTLDGEEKGIGKMLVVH